jgi:protein gp37
MIELFTNIRIGVTCENQEMADERIPVLLNNWHGKNFISVEPMLGPVDLLRSVFDPINPRVPLLSAITINLISDSLDWVICGGESGSDARPTRPEWVTSLRDQCIRSGVPFHFKQWGEWGPSRSGETMIRYGRNISGSLIDGIEYKEFPK